MQTKLEASNLFLQGLVMRYGHDVMMNMYEMIIIVLWQPAGALWLSLNFMLRYYFKVVVIVATCGGQP